VSAKEQPQAIVVRKQLESYLHVFTEYSREVFGDHRREQLDDLRLQLQRQEPRITAHIISILGDGVFGIPRPFSQPTPIAHRDVLALAVAGGNNEEPHNFRDYKPAVEMLVNGAIGTIDAELWPPTEPKSTLIIKDTVLRQRCFDLLGAPGNFDRVIREATIIMEDKTRNKVSHDTLTKLIPQSGDQTGEKLINKLFAPSNPIIIFSEDKDTRIAFHKMLIGINAFLRNPHHHRLDDRVEWSWAWSVIGFIDKLLHEIDSCTTSESQET